MTHSRHLPLIDSTQPVRSLGRLLLPYRGRLAAVAGVFAVKDSVVWLTPVITAAAVDTVVDGGPLSTIGWLALAAALLLAQVYPTHLLFTRIYMGVVRRVAAELRGLATVRLQTLSIGYYQRTSAAVVQSKIVRDVENVELMFAQLGNPLGSAAVVFCGAVTMTALNVPQFLPIYAFALPCGVAIWWVMRRRTQERNELFRKQMEQYARRVGEMASLMPVFRAHGLESQSTRRVAEDADGVRRLGLKLDMVNGHFGAASWVAMQVLATGCLLAAAALSVAHLVDITPGQVVLLGTYFTTLTGTVLTVLNFLPLIARGRESIVSLGELLEEPDHEGNDGKPAVHAVAGGFELDGVTVTFGESAAPALDDIHLRIEPGEVVAFVGSSGSGKSTLVNTMLGFLRPTRGAVRVDGLDLRDIDLRTLRRHISVVPQESVLFDGTIRENLVFGLETVDEQHVERALRDAHLEELLVQFPDGLETRVGDRGSRLSGGQRQRISIARALIRQPRVLVLDEATSALDAESESGVRAALLRRAGAPTTLIVAHRLATITHADRILVLERGRIMETGTHEQLLAVDGRYRTLWDLQVQHV